MSTVLLSTDEPYKAPRLWRATILLTLLCFLVWIVPAAALGRTQDGRAIYGYVWHDWDEDAVRDAAEPALSGVLVTLTNEKGALLAFTHTNTTGYYRFEGLGAGQYCVAETDPEGFVSTTANLAAITLDGQSVQQDFGDLLLLPGCFRMIDGLIWHDANDDGAADADESRLEGVALRVLDLDHNLAAVTVSDAEGRYAIRNLDPEAYYVILDPPIGMSRSRFPLHWGVGLQGCHPAIIEVGLQQSTSRESDVTPMKALPSSERLAHSYLASDDLVSTAGSSEGATLSGVVWLLASATESITRNPASGVKLTLTDAQGHIVAEQTSDAQGRYRFENLKWQHYYLTQETIAGYAPVLSDFWGVAATDGSEIVINLENTLSSGDANSSLFIPLVFSTRSE